MGWMAAVGGAAGGLGGGMMGAVSGAITNAKNLEQARNVLWFQKQLSLSQYQRAADDLKLAGINPILAGTFGGASTPPGAMIPLKNPLEGAGSLGVTAQKAAEEMKLMRELQKTEREKRVKMGYEEALLARSSAYKEIERKILATRVPGAQIEQSIDQGELGKWTRYLGRILPGLGTAKQLSK